MFFPNAFKKVFLASSGTAVAGSLGTNDATMVGGKLGFFTPTSTANSTLVSVAAPGGTGAYSVKPFFLVQGSYYSVDKIGAHGGYKESIKSKLINPKYISRVIKISAQTARNQVVKVNANGFVGTNQTYRLRLDVKGSPALRFLNHQIYRSIDAYSGGVNTTDATKVWRDPVAVLLGWKEQVNANPFLSQYIQARVYKYVIAQTSTGNATGVTTTQATIPMTTTTSIVAGQKIVDTATTPAIPANSFVSSVNAGVSIVIKYPTQSVAPTINTGTACKFYTDIYSTTEVAALSGTNAYQSIYIPGTTTATGLAANPTGFDITSNDAAAQTINQDSHIEFTVAYVDTTFGNATFTPTDKYELEPLYVYAAVQDELSNTNLALSFNQNTTAVSATKPYLSSHGIEVQSPVQTQGIGETVLRDLILSGRYAQNAYPDSSRVESFRQREIEADPMLSSVTRSSLYDQYLILHNVPRWNNPASVFDNDQYLISIYVAAGTSISNITDFVIVSANFAQTGTASLSNLIALESY